MSTAFEPVRIGRHTARNRVVMAPMTRSRAYGPGGTPTELMATYYAQRAGAGLIVTEGTQPSPIGQGYLNTPGLHTPEQIAGWKAVTDAVHARGGLIFAQLMHTGRIGHPSLNQLSATPVGASAVRADGTVFTADGPADLVTPEPLDDKGIQQTVEDFADAARNAVEAGFDGVELHGANGYLLEQFLHPQSNQRTDAYGGSVRNRARFVLEVTRGVADAIGADRTGIRLSPWSKANDLTHYPEIDEAYGYLADELQKIGIVYVHLVDHARLSRLDAAAATAKIVRDTFTNTVIHAGNYTTLAAIEETLADPRPTLVAMARPFIANPDLVERLRLGLPLAEPDRATFYAPGPNGFTDGYTDYPTAEETASV